MAEYDWQSDPVIKPPPPGQAPPASAYDWQSDEIIGQAPGAPPAAPPAAADPQPPEVTRRGYYVEEPQDPIQPGQAQSLSPFTRGVARGATFEFGDEAAGLMAAGADDPREIALSPTGSLLRGGARLAREYLTGTGTEAPKGSGDPALQLARREAGLPPLEPTPRPGSATEAARRATEEQRNANRLAEMEAPGTTLAGQFTGAVVAPIGAQALRGVAMGIRMLRGAITAGTVGGVTGIGEGEGLGDRAQKGATGAFFGGTIGAGLPVVGEPIARVGRWAVRPVARAIQRYRDEEGAAARAVAETVEHAQSSSKPVASLDSSSRPTVLARSDFDRLKAEGEPVANLDLAGRGGHRLARTAGNLDKDADAVLKDMVQSRAATESERTSNFISRLIGNKRINIDEVRARKTGPNSAAYKKAYADGRAANAAEPPGPGAFDTVELRRLSRSPDVQDAMLSIGRREGNRTIIEGRQSPGHSPWVAVDTPAGQRLEFRTYNTGKGTQDKPSLEDWDQVQRILRAKIAKQMGPNGEVTEDARQLIKLRDAVNAELDRIVPSFKNARGTAYAGFRAEDAWEAGEKYVMGNYSAREAAALSKQIKRFSNDDRELFMHGFAESLIKRVMSKSDPMPIINRIYNTDIARERVVEAMGPKRAKELEAYLHVARIATSGKRAVEGGSSTTREVMDVFRSLGREAQTPVLGAVAYGVASGNWDWTNILAGYGTHKARGWTRGFTAERDRRIAGHIGEMLASKDPDAFKRGVAILASHQRFMDRIRNFATPVSKAAAPQTTDVDLGLGELSKQPAPAN